MEENKSNENKDKDKDKSNENKDKNTNTLNKDKDKDKNTNTNFNTNNKNNNPENFSSKNLLNIKRKYKELSIIPDTTATESNKHLRIDTSLINEGHIKKNFEDFKKVGEGGFGSVFKASHKIDGSLYALKVIKLNVEISKSLKDHKVIKEVKTMMKLNHKNVVRYYTCWFQLNIDEIKHFANEESENNTYTSNTNTNNNNTNSNIFSTFSKRKIQNLKKKINVNNNNTVSKINTKIKENNYNNNNDIKRNLNNLNNESVFDSSYDKSNNYSNSRSSLIYERYCNSRIKNISKSQIKNKRSNTSINFYSGNKSKIKHIRYKI